MPFRLGVTTAVRGSVSGIIAPTFVASGFGRDVSNVILRYLVARNSGVIVWRLMASGVGSFTRSVGFLVHANVDSFELVIRVALPWFVGLVGAVWWWHPVALAIGDSIVAMQGVVPVGFKGMPNDVVVSVIVKDRPPGESWDFDVVAHS